MDNSLQSGFFSSNGNIECLYLIVDKLATWKIYCVIELGNHYIGIPRGRVGT